MTEISTPHREEGSAPLPDGSPPTDTADSEENVSSCTCVEPGSRVQHRLAEPSKWPWLPTQGNGLLAQHPWCKDCGRVKVVGAEKAREFGGLVNLLGHLERRLREHGYRVTEAQKRLIVKKLQELEADDNFALTRTSQERVLTEIVARYLGMKTETVDTYLHS